MNSIPLQPLHNTFVILFIFISFLQFFVNGKESIVLIADRKTCISTEREALLTFKRGLIDEHDLLSSWSSEDRNNDCCQWTGVICSDQTGHVVALGLSSPILRSIKGLESYACLKGNLSSSLLELHQLSELHLSQNSFEGPIPMFIGSLSELEFLDLSYCNFHGIIPFHFGNLTRLRYLDLSSNNIIGPLPDFTASSSLQNLHLSRNQLNGTLPESIGQLSMLEVLDVCYNSLEGVISEAHFLNLGKLKELHLSFNSLEIKISSEWVPPFQLNTIDLRFCKLGPRFPTWFRTQTNFSYLDISYSKIADSIPMWFWDQSTTRIKYFSASSNAITGVIPDLSSKFADYPSIDLSDNFLEGSIPVFPSRLTSLNLSRNKFSGGLTFLCGIVDGFLSFLDLSENVLSGEIPDHCLNQQLKNLIILNLSHNKLSGKIPSSIGASSMIETIDLLNNSLSGELPLSLKNCTNLKFLNLGSNNMSGIIPSWIGEGLQKLYVFVMRSNHFNGSIPLNFCLLAKLQLLDLSQNDMSGQIPQCFNNFTAMVHKGTSFEITSHAYISSYITRDDETGIEYFSAKFNDSVIIQWKGSEREFGNGLGQLKSIDLSGNELTGEIPEGMLELVEMVALNISRNKLHGHIPQRIGQLISLESLDLSRNGLSGKIPLSLSSLHFLSYLDLAYNNLSGRIPSGTQLQTFNASQYTGNDELCGHPLTPKCPGDLEENEAQPFSIPDGEDDDEYYKWFYTGLAVGYLVALFAFSGALLLYRPWRRAYFLQLDNLKDSIYVRVAVRLAK